MQIATDSPERHQRADGDSFLSRQAHAKRSFARPAGVTRTPPAQGSRS